MYFTHYDDPERARRVLAENARDIAARGIENNAIDAASRCRTADGFDAELHVLLASRLPNRGRVRTKKLEDEANFDSDL